MIDLYELAKDYCMYESLSADGELEGDDLEEWEALEVLNKVLEGELDYPRQCQEGQVIRDEPSAFADYAKQWASDMYDLPQDLLEFINWEDWGRQLVGDMSDVIEFEWDGGAYLWVR